MSKALKLEKDVDPRLIEALYKQIFEIRWLNGVDEKDFIELLTSVYGTTYSYFELYQQGYYSGLVSKGKLSSYGEFDSVSGKLISHIGFHHKDEKKDYLICGTGFKHPSITKMDAETQKRNWKYLLSHFTKTHSFIHQETTTYHQLAQMHSQKAINAKATGIILNYVSGEKLAKIQHTEKPMVALTMTTILNSAQQEIFIPAGHWGEWIRLVYNGMGVERTFLSLKSNNLHQYGLNTFEENKFISMRRSSLTSSILKNDEMEFRNDLVHVDLTDKNQVNYAFTSLILKNYLPVNIRLGHKRGDEIVFQKLPAERSEYLSQLADAKIFGDRSKGIVKGWIECFSE